MFIIDDIIGGIIVALLAAAGVTLAIITLDWLFDFIANLIREWNTTVLTRDTQDLISDLMNKEISTRQATDIEALKKKAGKKGMFTAAVKNGVVVKESLRLVSSDKRDEETENLMRENNGLLYVA